jgi:inner membrane protein
MVGEAVHRSTMSTSKLTETAHRNVAIAVMVVGGNLPDLDLIHTELAGTKLALIIHWVRRLARRAYLGDLHLCF